MIILKKEKRDLPELVQSGAEPASAGKTLGEVLDEEEK
jgi:hypothetical protein